MRILKAVIAEDEAVLRAELKDRFLRPWPELVVSAEAEDGFQALQALEQHAPDILFLDIQMPGLSGLGGREPGERQMPRRVRHGLRRVGGRRVRAGCRRLRDEAVHRGTPRFDHHEDQGTKSAVRRRISTAWCESSPTSPSSERNICAASPRRRATTCD
jgi:hypothetical protein